MASVPRLMLVLALTFSFSLAALAQDASLIQPGVGVGNIKLGMARDQVIAILGKPDLEGPVSDQPQDPAVPVSPEKTNSSALQYFKHKITILVRASKVSGIMVLHPQYHTANGIGVDSRIADVQNAFGASGVRKDGQYGPDISYPGAGIRFIFLGEQVMGIEVRPPSAR